MEAAEVTLSGRGRVWEQGDVTRAGRESMSFGNERRRKKKKGKKERKYRSNKRKGREFNTQQRLQELKFAS